MLALPFPPASIIPVVVFAAIGCIMFAALAVTRYTESRRNAGSLSPDQETVNARKCRYCRRGESLLREESVRMDGDDLIDVRFYVCSHCGLPQWLVDRHGVTPRPLSSS